MHIKHNICQLSGNNRNGCINFKGMKTLFAFLGSNMVTSFSCVIDLFQLQSLLRIACYTTCYLHIIDYKNTLVRWAQFNSTVLLLSDYHLWMSRNTHRKIHSFMLLKTSSCCMISLMPANFYLYSTFKRFTKCVTYRYWGRGRQITNRIIKP